MAPDQPQILWGIPSLWPLKIQFRTSETLLLILLWEPWHSCSRFQAFHQHLVRINNDNSGVLECPFSNKPQVCAFHPQDTQICHQTSPQRLKTTDIKTHNIKDTQICHQTSSPHQSTQYIWTCTYTLACMHHAHTCMCTHTHTHTWDLFEEGWRQL